MTDFLITGVEHDFDVWEKQTDLVEITIHTTRGEFRIWVETQKRMNEPLITLQHA